MGRDGDTTWINRYVARDAFGFNLGYYTGDYTPISSTVTPFPGYSAYLGAAYKPLFNGNISSMVVNIGQFNNPMLYAYTYDHLNRLTGMNAHTGFNQSTNSWSALSASNDYKESVEYDPNGNITRYQRNGVSSMNLAMDNLTYAYNKDGNGKLINNRLNHVADAVSSDNYTTDIDDQSADNYSYDEIGNLTGDNAEGITDIKWNVYGKIREIQRSATDSNPTVNIKYTYDAAGNRISKQVTTNSGNITYTWYTRDAQGNVMSTYKSAGTGSTLTAYSVDLSEQLLYGSSRLGILNRYLNMKASYTREDIVSFYRGYKQYELSNHLGNVLATITDKKNGVSANGTTIDNYTADVSSANDYYPFGMGMINRGFSVGKYRYGFNGKENDKEFGEGIQDYGMRINDNRLGRFLSVDPLSAKFSYLTPYQYASNTPIQAIDLDGLESVNVNTGKVENNLSQENIAAKKISYKDISPWKDLISFQLPSSVYKEADKRVVGLYEQPMSYAYSDKLNLDYYSVTIEKLPDQVSPEKFFETIRKEFSFFAQNSQSQLSDYNSDEDKKWKSDDPLGAVLHFDVALYKGPLGYLLGDDLSVITSSYTKSDEGFSWTLSPVETIRDGTHPLAGHRQFGLTINKSATGVTTYTFFTRGVDKPWGGLENSVSHIIFKGAHELWMSAMNNIASYVNANNGKANVGEHLSKRVTMK